MKMTIALIALTFAAVANASVYPRVWNNGRTVAFDAWNTTNQNVRCNGPLYLRMDDDTQDTIYVQEYLWPGQSIYRTYYPNSVGKTIRSISHGVWCW